jgi:16S rRNA (cytosine967-C5)-methyltransferase
LEQSDLERRDRDFATELTYGTTRMRRALDFLLDHHLRRDVEPEVRNALRLGAYQLHFLRTPAHAAVSATVDVAPGRARGFVNAVLRKVAGTGAPRWPDLATELSYPDWIVDQLVADLGAATARAALEAMNQPPAVVTRPDGYVQDTASQWVAELVGATAADIVVDLCAGPGGKATALGSDVVIALDAQPHRAALVVANARRYGHPEVRVAVADGRRPPLRRGRADRVLVDAPCSGLGVLGRRADARWRIEREDIERLVGLQRHLLSSALDLLRPGGLLVYSVCTITRAETAAVDNWLASAFPALTPVAPPPPWEPVGRGGRLLPQAEGTDGMYVLRLRQP